VKKNDKTFLKIILGMVILGLLLFLFLFLNNYQILVFPRVKPILNVPPGLSGECGIENCHGLAITCGPNVAEACTFQYEIGDKCRSYASCQVVDGKCQLVKKPEFEVCKSCVEKCQKKYPDDVVKISECEAECP